MGGGIGLFNCKGALKHVTVNGCSASSTKGLASGGGIAVLYSQLVFEDLSLVDCSIYNDCTIHDQCQLLGGAMVSASSSMVMNRCLLRDCNIFLSDIQGFLAWKPTVPSYHVGGGAVSLIDAVSTFIENSTFEQNHSFQGGAIDMRCSSAHFNKPSLLWISNCTLR